MGYQTAQDAHLARPGNAAAARSYDDETKIAVFVMGVVCAVTLLRAALLFTTGFEFYGDEAQYWTYAQEPGFGYYSKPPMIAWLISAGGLACGPSEACARLASPLLHGVASLFVYLTGVRLASARAGLWAALAYLTLPAVTYSSLLISTDVPLLAAWSVALYALVRLQEDIDASRIEAWIWAGLLGCAIGAGLLSKYAMIYFVLGLVLYCLWAGKLRSLLLRPPTLAALALGAAVWSPNLVWNLQNGGATLLHVTENANLSGPLFRPEKALEFLGSQFGVFGPIMMAALLARLGLLRQQPPDDTEQLLISLSAPIILMILGQALLAGANANWAASAYVAGTLLVVLWLVRIGRTTLIGASVGLHLAIAAALGLVLSTGAINALPGGAKLQSQVSGWRDLAKAVDTAMAGAASAGTAYDYVVTDHRFELAELWYYRSSEMPALRILGNGSISNHYELTRPLEIEANARYLYVTRRGVPAPQLVRAGKISPVSKITVPAGAERTRSYTLYAVEIPPEYRR